MPDYLTDGFFPPPYGSETMSHIPWHDVDAPPFGSAVLADDAHERRPRDEVQADGDPDPARQRRERKLILLVEDEPSTQDIYGSILEYDGFDVLIVADGLEAVQRAQAEVPDLILMDINLPGQDGWEATKSLKRDDRTRHIPVIGISASAGPSYSRRAMDLGFESYHAKPFSPVSMLSEVRRVLGVDEGSEA